MIDEAGRAPDPPNSPLVRPVLYTNDVKRLVHSFVSGLLTVAEPDRVRAALRDLLDNWDEVEAQFRSIREAVVTKLQERRSRSDGEG